MIFLRGGMRAEGSFGQVILSRHPNK
jgi:hypothetical protein